MFLLGTKVDSCINSKDKTRQEDKDENLIFPKHFTQRDEGPSGIGSDFDGESELSSRVYIYLCIIYIYICIYTSSIYIRMGMVVEFGI